MTEIAQLFESALRQNRASLLRQAAKSTIAKMPPGTTLRELLESDAADAVRALTLAEMTEALADAGFVARRSAGVGGRRRRVVQGSPKAGAPDTVDVASEGHSDSKTWGSEPNDAQLFRRILDAMVDEPLTIGQLSKEVGITVDELRGYLAWMKKAGKVVSSGRARATRYQAVQE